MSSQEKKKSEPKVRQVLWILRLIVLETVFGGRVRWERQLVLWHREKKEAMTMTMMRSDTAPMRELRVSTALHSFTIYTAHTIVLTEATVKLKFSCWEAMVQNGYRTVTHNFTSRRRAAGFFVVLGFILPDLSNLLRYSRRGIRQRNRTNIKHSGLQIARDVYPLASGYIFPIKSTPSIPCDGMLFSFDRWSVTKCWLSTAVGGRDTVVARRRDAAWLASGWTLLG